MKRSVNKVVLTEHEKSYVLENYGTVSVAEMSFILSGVRNGYFRNLIDAFLIDEGIKTVTTGQKITKHQESLLIKYANTKRPKQLLESVGLNYGTGVLKKVRDLLLEHGIILYKDSDVNHNFFNVLDTEEKAYILGFILADGNIRLIKNKKSEKGEVRIEIHKQDVDILQKIKKALGYKPSLRKDGKFVSLDVKSTKMFYDLMSLGLVPNKTYKDLSGMHIPDGYLFWHFLRGFIDGDGGFAYNTDKYGSTYCLGYICQSITNKNLIYRLKLYLSELNIESTVYIDKTKNAIYLRFYNNNLESLIDRLYKDSTIYLDRKLLKAKQIKNIFNLKR